MSIKALLCSAAVFGLFMAASALANDAVIHAGRLIDGLSTETRTQVSILIHDDRITAVQSGFISPSGYEAIDLSNATVLPGLIDCHVHVTGQFDGGNPIVEQVAGTRFDAAIKSTAYARATLLAGFTSARDVGADTGIIVALKTQIARGIVPGPRLWVSGAPLGPTGGHTDQSTGLDPELSDPAWAETIIDGPEEARRAVREHKKLGVDLIKIMPSGGVLSVNDDPNRQLMADDEIKAVIDTAHALGLKVAAHAHGKQAVDTAVRLGVDSIEHGSFADEESYKLMKQHGTYLVPTMLVAQTVYGIARAHPEQLNPSSAQKALMVAPRIKKNLHDAYEAGVKIAFGTDQSLAPHGTNAKEFALMVAAGMSPMDAIIAATGSAADLIGDSQDIGSIRSGHYADIVAVDGNPLTDIRMLEHVQFVMKGGTIYKQNGQIIAR